MWYKQKQSREAGLNYSRIPGPALWEHLRPQYCIFYLTVSPLQGLVPSDWPPPRLYSRAGSGVRVPGLHPGERERTARSAPSCFKTVSAWLSGTESTTKLEEAARIVKGARSLPPPVSRGNLSETLVPDFS